MRCQQCKWETLTEKERERENRNVDWSACHENFSLFCQLLYLAFSLAFLLFLFIFTLLTSPLTPREWNTLVSHHQRLHNCFASRAHSTHRFTGGKLNFLFCDARVCALHTDTDTETKRDTPKQTSSRFDSKFIHFICISPSLCLSFRLHYVTVCLSHVI